MLNRFRQIWKRWSNLGVRSTDPFSVTIRYKILNYVCLTTLIVPFVFLIVNLFSKQYLLATTNLIACAAAIGCLWFSYKRMYELGLVALGLTFSVAATISAIYTRNGLEFYPLLNIGTSILILHRRSLIFLVATINSILFITYSWFEYHQIVYEVLPFYRVCINNIVCCLTTVLIIGYFKKLYRKFELAIQQQGETISTQTSELKLQKNILEVQNRELQVLNNTKEKLFSIVAHDIRTPVAGLKSLLDLFKKNIVTKDEFERLTESLSAQVDQLQDGLDNLLEWSHSQLGGIKTNTQNVRLLDLIQKVILPLNYVLEAKKIRIAIHVQPQTTVLADANHLQLIIRNLLTNAIKFSYVGGTILIEAQLNSQGMVAISVKDEGVGMSMQQQHNLLNQQSFDTTRGTLNEKGTGIGLLLCYEFAANNKGYLQIEGKSNEGTTVTLYLPAP
jgi:two-component system, sensor histidine kinase and response regulator